MVAMESSAAEAALAAHLQKLNNANDVSQERPQSAGSALSTGGRRSSQLSARLAEDIASLSTSRPTSARRATLLQSAAVTSASAAAEDVAPEEKEKRLVANDLAAMGSALGVGDFLGEGSSGAVYAVTGALGNFESCLKIVDCKDMAKQRELEVDIFSELGGHTSIVRYQLGWFSKNRERLYVLMRRCERELWDEVLGDKSEDGLSFATKLRWSIQVAEGLAHIHRKKFIHRDLSPWNIFTRKNESDMVDLKIGDFGLSVPDGEYSGFEAAVGMPLDDSATGSIFSAPELGSDTGYTQAVDLFSLGQILFFIWHAQPDGADEVVDDLENIKDNGALPSAFGPVVIRDLVQKLVSADASARPSAQQTLRRLRRWQDDEAEAQEALSRRSFKEGGGDAGPAPDADHTPTGRARAESGMTGEEAQTVEAVLTRLEAQRTERDQDLSILQAINTSCPKVKQAAQSARLAIHAMNDSSDAMAHRLSRGKSMRYTALPLHHDQWKRRHVHFIRHAESEFNVAHAKTGRDPYIFDCDLTDTGVKQATELREKLRQLQPDLIVTSPLYRTCRTMALAIDAENDEAMKATPMQIWAELSETLEASCDLGSTGARLEAAFPFLPWQRFFDGCSSDQVWWYHPRDDCPLDGMTAEEAVAKSHQHFKENGFMETDTRQAARADTAVEKLRATDAENVVIFGHCDMIHDILLRHFCRDVWLGNCEVFSVHFV